MPLPALHHLTFLHVGRELLPNCCQQHLLPDGGLWRERLCSGGPTQAWSTPDHPLITTQRCRCWGSVVLLTVSSFFTLNDHIPPWAFSSSSLAQQEHTMSQSTCDYILSQVLNYTYRKKAEMNPSPLSHHCPFSSSSPPSVTASPLSPPLPLPSLTTLPLPLLPHWSPPFIPHEVVALPLVQLVHWGQVIEHAPECLNGLHHTYLAKVGKEITRCCSFWGTRAVGDMGGGESRRASWRGRV